MNFLEKFYPLDSNNIISLRNKFSDVQLIIIEEIYMVSKKLLSHWNSQCT